MTEKDAPKRGNGEGSLFWHEGRQRWCVRTTVDGKLRTAYAKTKTEARAKLDALRRLESDGKPATDGSMTVAELLEQWRHLNLEPKGLADKTLESYDWSIPILKAELGTLRLKSLTTDDVEAALNRRVHPTHLGKTGNRTGPTGQTTKALGQRSATIVRGHLRQALNWGIGRRYVTWNCALVAELPPKTPPGKPQRSMTKQQADAFLRAAQGTPLGALWTLMLLTAMRPGEAGGLEWEDVIFDPGDVPGLGEGDGVIHVRPNRQRRLKNAASKRDVGVPKAAVDALRSHGMNQMLDGERSERVFLSATGAKLDPSKMRKEFKAVAVAAGLDESWHPHSLRHTAISLLKAARQPMQDLTDLAGHGELRTTELYSHLLEPVTAYMGRMKALFPQLD